jgi:hypothetical protein
MKKIKYWSIFVGLPKWEWWNDQKKFGCYNGVGWYYGRNGSGSRPLAFYDAPNMSCIGNVCIGHTKYISRKKAQEVADRLSFYNKAWNFIVNPSWDQRNGGNK